MATQSLMRNPNFDLVTSSMGDMCQPRQHSFGQVSLPQKTRVSSSKRSLFTASVMAPAAITTVTLTAAPVTSIGTHEDVEGSDIDYSLARHWRDVQGCNDWENLIDPLHPLLRQEITRYGEFVAACYRAFDLDPNSKRYLNCKYGKKSLLEESGIENSGYQVTKYIYATPDINIKIPIQNNEPARGRWVGYVAVSSDDSVKNLGRRDIVVTFRGTVTNPEWITNFMSSLTPARLDPHEERTEVKVESGFLSLYTSDESQSKFGLESCRQQLLAEISRLLNKYKGEDLSITLAGHSMGSALALLLAYDISELGLNLTNSRNEEEEKIPVTVFSFGGPRVGNLGFKERCEELGVKVLRIVNVNDPITKLPGVVFNENFGVLGGKYELPWSCSCYSHVGVELALDFFDVQNPACVHDLKSYINLLKFPTRRSSVGDDDHRVENENSRSVDQFLGSAKEVIFSGLRRQRDFKMLPLRNAATNVVDLISSVSNQMLYYSIF